MSIKSKLMTLFEISLINTLRMNIHYIGWGGVTHPCFIVSKSVKIDKLGGKVILHKPQIGCIRIGFGNTHIFDKKYERSIWFNNGTIEFLGRASLGRGCRISNNGHICIGDCFTVNGATSIVCQKKITFGQRNLISWDCLIMDTDFHKIYRLDDNEQIPVNNDCEIVFGDNVWLCCKSIVLKGSTIPCNSVIAAGSCITKYLYQTNSIYSDNRMIKDNIYWQL